jgi:hypothetical protein
MTDPIEKLTEDIRQCQEVQRTRFSNNFLNTVGEVFECDGFGTTRTFLLEKRERQDLRHQAGALLKVLDLMGAHPEIRQRRAIGRTLIKALIAIKGFGTRT